MFSTEPLLTSASLTVSFGPSVNIVSSPISFMFSTEPLLTSASLTGSFGPPVNVVSSPNSFMFSTELLLASALLTGSFGLSVNVVSSPISSMFPTEPLLVPTLLTGLSFAQSVNFVSPLLCPKSLPSTSKLSSSLPPSTTASSHPSSMTTSFRYTPVSFPLSSTLAVGLAAGLQSSSSSWSSLSSLLVAIPPSFVFPPPLRISTIASAAAATSFLPREYDWLYSVDLMMRFINFSALSGTFFLNVLPLYVVDPVISRCVHSFHFLLFFTLSIPCSYFTRDVLRGPASPCLFCALSSLCLILYLIFFFSASSSLGLL